GTAPDHCRSREISVEGRHRSGECREGGLLSRSGSSADSDVPRLLPDSVRPAADVRGRARQRGGSSRAGADLHGRVRHHPGLVAGYHTEYSAMKFAFFMLAEYSAMLVNCCLIVSLFFGGWTLAMFNYGLTSSVLRHWGWIGGLLGAVIFFVKVMSFMMVYIWF